MGVDVCKIVVREFNPERDSGEVEAVERWCEVGPAGKMSLFTHLLGDPLCRVRNSPAFLMLVAEDARGDDEKRIVGMIRGCVKTVTRGKKVTRIPKQKPVPVYAKLAYILGLRVSPSHRRMGVGMKLVLKMEQWFRDNVAEYSYIATDPQNHPSLALFTGKCNYVKFRTPTVLVRPVFAHSLRLSSRVTILKLTPSHAQSLYRSHFSNAEFFPCDIDSVLNNPLSLGTFVAIPNATRWSPSDPVMPNSWAVVSIWNCKDVFNLEVRGAAGLMRGVARMSRALDRACPWLRIPSVPQVFTPFGLQFMYGLGGEGPGLLKLVRALCDHAHNVAKSSGCGVVVTEVLGSDPAGAGVPYWKSLSGEDVWCMKRLVEDYSDRDVGDWTKSHPGLSVFVDPREF